MDEDYMNALVRCDSAYDEGVGSLFLQHQSYFDLVLLDKMKELFFVDLFINEVKSFS